MAKKYNSSWYSKEMIVDFNQKQWRQDLAAFIRNKLFWDLAKVTRSKSISNRAVDKGIKKFDVYDGYGNSVSITYEMKNQILNSTNLEVVLEYLKIKNK